MNHIFSSELAVVIPAYKDDFLAEALASLAAQTYKTFTVYIGDDQSPYDLEPIVDGFRDQLHIVYKRFEENLGGHSLIRQWNRCVRMSSEPWVWLFSDDDMADPECIEHFSRKRSETSSAFSIYRFDLGFIDSDGKVTGFAPPHPEAESSAVFLYHWMNGHRACAAPECIFSRKVFESSGGFVDFPVGWISDVASWALFGKKTGICKVAGSKVYWRKSEVQLSYMHTKLAYEKAKATVMFIQWMDDAILDNVKDNDIARLLKKLRYNVFRRQINLLSSKMAVGDLFKISSESSRVFGFGKWYLFRQIYPGSLKKKCRRLLHITR